MTFITVKSCIFTRHKFSRKQMSVRFVTKLQQLHSDVDCRSRNEFPCFCMWYCAIYYYLYEHGECFVWNPFLGDEVKAHGKETRGTCPYSMVNGTCYESHRITFVVQQTWIFLLCGALMLSYEWKNSSLVLNCNVRIGERGIFGDTKKSYSDHHSIKVKVCQDRLPLLPMLISC